jgi:hypothetical protein
MNELDLSMKTCFDELCKEYFFSVLWVSSVSAAAFHRTGIQTIPVEFVLSVLVLIRQTHTNITTYVSVMTVT